MTEMATSRWRYELRLTRGFYEMNRAGWPETSRLRALYSAVRCTVMVNRGRWWPKRTSGSQEADDA